METQSQISTVSLSCDQEHIIHRVGNPDYPVQRQMTVRADDADSWEVVLALYAQIAEARNTRLAEIEAYDTSDAVNRFYLNNTAMWLDKATRVGLVNSVNATELTGGTAITFWHDNTAYDLPLPVARQMLASLEVYALECFNTTARHRANIEALIPPEAKNDHAVAVETLAAINAYDITADYPPHPNFSTGG